MKRRQIKKYVEILILYVTSIFLILFGGYGVYRSGSYLINVIKLKSWVEAPCRVDNLWLIDKKYAYPIIAGEFHYRWQGKDYASQNISLSTIYYHESLNNVVNVDGFNVGTELMCLVNPKNPEEALLRKSSWPRVLMSSVDFLFMVTLLLGGVFMLAKMIFSKESDEID